MTPTPAPKGPYNPAAHQYPKWVYNAEGKSVIVNDPDEAKAQGKKGYALEAPPEEPAAAPDALAATQAENAELRRRIAELEAAKPPAPPAK